MTGTLKLLIQRVPGKGTAQVGAVIHNPDMIQSIIFFDNQVGGFSCQTCDEGTSSRWFCQDLCGWNWIPQNIFSKNGTPHPRFFYGSNKEFANRIECGTSNSRNSCSGQKVKELPPG
jgi:hypothetical protein